MKKITLASIIGFALILPFIILELVNRPGMPEGFPFALFGFLWFLAAAFVAIFATVVTNARAGNGLLASPIKLLLSVVFLIVIAAVWGGLLNDQMPCFMGVPNCD